MIILMCASNNKILISFFSFHGVFLSLKSLKNKPIMTLQRRKKNHTLPRFHKTTVDYTKKIKNGNASSKTSQLDKKINFNKRKLIFRTSPTFKGTGVSQTNLIFRAVNPS